MDTVEPTGHNQSRQHSFCSTLSPSIWRNLCYVLWDHWVNACSLFPITCLLYASGISEFENLRFLQKSWHLNIPIMCILVCALIQSFFVSHPWIHLQYFGLQIQSIKESITLPLCNNWRDSNDGDECVKPFQPSKVVSSLAIPKGKRLCTRDSSIFSVILAWNRNQCLWVRTGYNSPHFILFSNGYFRINLWKFSCLCKHEYVISDNYSFGEHLECCKFSPSIFSNQELWI